MKKPILNEEISRIRTIMGINETYDGGPEDLAKMAKSSNELRNKPITKAIAQKAAENAKSKEEAADLAVKLAKDKGITDSEHITHIIDLASSMVKENSLEENIFNTPYMGGITNSKGTAGYIDNTSKMDKEYADSLKSEDDKIIEKVVEDIFKNDVITGKSGAENVIKDMQKDWLHKKGDGATDIYDFIKAYMYDYIQGANDHVSMSDEKWGWNEKETEDSIYGPHAKNIVDQAIENAKEESDSAIDMMEGKWDVDPTYTHFAVNKNTGRIVTGWDYGDTDKESIIYYSKIDLKDMDLDPKDFKISTKRFLLNKGVDPMDSDNWEQTIHIDNLSSDMNEETTEENEME